MRKLIFLTVLISMLSMAGLVQAETCQFETEWGLVSMNIDDAWQGELNGQFAECW